jgi:hypothetical protein
MSNINRILTFEIVSVADAELFYHIKTLPVNEQTEVIQTIEFSEKWKKYNSVGLSEQAVLTKFAEIGAEVLGIDEATFQTRIETEGKQVVLDDFIDTLLQYNIDNGIINFPFQAGQSLHDFSTKLSDYLDTVSTDFTFPPVEAEII